MRDSDRHGPRVDEELDREVRGLVQGNRPSRAEQWRDPEPDADDDPDPRAGDLSRARDELAPDTDSEGGAAGE